MIIAITTFTTLDRVSFLREVICYSIEKGPYQTMCLLCKRSNKHDDMYHKGREGGVRELQYKLS